MKLPKVPQRTTTGFVFPMIERTLKECFAARQFGQEEIAQVLKFFGAEQPECAFCGSSEVKRWDHLLSISKDGETVLGNMVLACAQCDDSKQDKPFEEWMTSGTKYSPKSLGIKDVSQRIKRIKTYIQHFGYVPRSLEDRLNKHELERLKIIRSKLLDIRGDIEMLIKDYGARTI